MKGDVITAVEGVRFEEKAELEDSLPKPVRYNQLDPPGPRKPLRAVVSSGGSCDGFRTRLWRRTRASGSPKTAA